MNASSFSVADVELTVFDGDPRALDLDIAKRLGFAKPVTIRKLIERHAESLSRFGVISTVEKTSGKAGGRPATEYWLNEPQALFIASKSEADRANDVLTMLIKVFMAWRHGHLTGSVEFDQATRNMLGGMIKRNAGVVVRQELEPVHADLDAMRRELADLRDRVRPGSIRRDGVPARTIWQQYALPRLKCGTLWLGNQLKKMGAAAEFDYRADIAGKPTRLFDPDKARHCMENGLLNTARTYVAERQGQGRLKLVERE